MLQIEFRDGTEKPLNEMKDDDWLKFEEDFDFYKEEHKRESKNANLR